MDSLSFGSNLDSLSLPSAYTSRRANSANNIPSNANDNHDDEQDSLLNLNGTANSAGPQTPHDYYDSDPQEYLFCDLERSRASVHRDTMLSKIVPSPSEPIDLDSETMLITSLSGSNNSNCTVKFHVSPLRGEQDVVPLYTADGVLAARIWDNNKHPLKIQSLNC